MDPKKMPKEMLKLKLQDGRPAFVFADSNGKMPLTDTNKERKVVCVYCGKVLESRDDTCGCLSFRKAFDYNQTLL